MNRTFVAVAALAVTLPWARPTAADEASKPCTERLLDPQTVVRCALAMSPEVEEARQGLAAIAGRRTAAGIWDIFIQV